MTELLRRWRARRRLEDIPDVAVLGFHRSRATNSLTQALMATLLDVSERHYQRLESGSRPLTAELASRIAYLLDLNPDERRALYRWAGLALPARQTPGTSVPADLIHYMDMLPFGAYFEDPEFNAIAYNARAAFNWPWMARPSEEGPANIMTSLLLEGPAREQCGKWETHWAPMLLAALRHQFMTYPSRAVHEMVETVCQDPKVSALWTSDASLSYHAYGTPRPMRLSAGTREWVWMTIMAWSPAHRPDLRLIAAVPTDVESQPKLPPGLTGGGVARPR